MFQYSILIICKYLKNIWPLIPNITILTVFVRCHLVICYLFGLILKEIVDEISYGWLHGFSLDFIGYLVLGLENSQNGIIKRKMVLCVFSWSGEIWAFLCWKKLWSIFTSFGVWVIKNIHVYWIQHFPLKFPDG